MSGIHQSSIWEEPIFREELRHRGNHDNQIHLTASSARLNADRHFFRWTNAGSECSRAAEQFHGTSLMQKSDPGGWATLKLRTDIRAEPSRNVQLQNSVHQCQRSQTLLVLWIVLFQLFVL